MKGIMGVGFALLPINCNKLPGEFPMSIGFHSHGTLYNGKDVDKEALILAAEASMEKLAGANIDAKNKGGRKDDIGVLVKRQTKVMKDAGGNLGGGAGEGGADADQSSRPSSPPALQVLDPGDSIFADSPNMLEGARGYGNGDIITCLVDRTRGLFQFWVNRVPICPKWQFFEPLMNDFMSERRNYDCHICVGSRGCSIIRFDFGSHGYSPITNAVLYSEKLLWTSPKFNMVFEEVVFGEQRNDNETIDENELRKKFFEYERIKKQESVRKKKELAEIYGLRGSGYSKKAHFHFEKDTFTRPPCRTLSLRERGQGDGTLREGGQGNFFGKWLNIAAKSDLVLSGGVGGGGGGGGWRGWGWRCGGGVRGGGDGLGGEGGGAAIVCGDGVGVGN